MLKHINSLREKTGKKSCLRNEETWLWENRDELGLWGKGSRMSDAEEIHWESQGFDADIRETKAIVTWREKKFMFRLTS